MSIGFRPAWAQVQALKLKPRAYYFILFFCFYICTPLHCTMDHLTHCWIAGCTIYLSHYPPSGKLSSACEQLWRFWCQAGFDMCPSPGATTDKIIPVLENWPQVMNKYYIWLSERMSFILSLARLKLMLTTTCLWLHVIGSSGTLLYVLEWGLDTPRPRAHRNYKEHVLHEY